MIHQTDISQRKFGPLASPAYVGSPLPSQALSTDDPAKILQFAVRSLKRGAVALATLTEIRGGAARALGSQMAIAEDGQYCGFVSGGCVEAAVAAEALEAIQIGRDRMVSFGEGSPFFDIVLPCGGGITLSIHVLRQSSSVEGVLLALKGRQSVALRYSSESQELQLVDPQEGFHRDDRGFVRAYSPSTRLLIAGANSEAATLSRLAKAANYPAISIAPNEASATSMDRFSAVVLLFHDLYRELPVLQAALRSEVFYVGALGSSRTHERRSALLREIGMGDEDVRRIKAPIGLFGPARDSTSLALSILADIAAARASMGQ